MILKGGDERKDRTGVAELVEGFGSSSAVFVICHP
jgi:hypothetical protein